MFENFGLEISRIFKNAEKIRYELKHPYVGTEHLLLAILKENNNCAKLLKKYDVTYSNFKKELVKITGIIQNVSEINLYTPLLKKVIENALEDAKENNDGIVTTRHLLFSMLEEGEGIALRVLLIMDIELDKLYDELKEKNKIVKDFKYGVILNKKVNDIEKVVCRDKEIERIIETLLRHKKNNPLLVGLSGVGKTAIVEELARRINKKEVPDELTDSIIVMLEMGSLVSGTKYRGEFEEKLTKIIEEASNNKNVILFIDEIHSMVNAGSADGAISASDILKPYLARDSIKIIGSTTINEYNKYFLKDKALCRRFEKILIEEPNLEDTKIILKAVKKEYEDYHNIKITNSNINDIVELSNKYIHDKCNPDKSIELLDTICASIKTKNICSNTSNDLKKLDKILIEKNNCVKNNEFDKAIEYKIIEDKLKNKIMNINNNKTKEISKHDILNVIESKTAIPLTLNKKEIVKKICDDLNKQVIGQKESIEKIKYNLLKDTGKVKSMMFIGTSGIGKTMSAKIIGKNYNVIKLDMGEYTKETSISKLIGVEPGYAGYDSPYIFEILKEKPYSLIIIDEIEKASSKVLSLFLNILDEGKICDSHGEEINFSNTLIIATGNIKTEKSVGFNKNIKKIDKCLSKELIARFDDIIEFNTLDYDDVYKYIKDNYNIDDNKIEDIINKSDYKKYGIRGIKRAIEEINCLQFT